MKIWKLLLSQYFVTFSINFNCIVCFIVVFVSFGLYLSKISKTGSILALVQRWSSIWNLPTEQKNVWGESKHLKGHSAPRVSDVTLLHQGLLRHHVSDEHLTTPTHHHYKISYCLPDLVMVCFAYCIFKFVYFVWIYLWCCILKENCILYLCVLGLFFLHLSNIFFCIFIVAYLVFVLL